MINTQGVPEAILRNSRWAIQEVEQQPQKWLETYELVKARRKELEAFLTPGYDVIFTGAGTSENIGGTITRELNLKEDRNFVTVGSPDIDTTPTSIFGKTRKPFWCPLLGAEILPSLWVPFSTLTNWSMT